MSLKRHVTRLSAASLSPFGEFLLRFIRTIILSRLLSPDDLGMAVVLTTILTSCEMITDVGLEKFVIVARPDARAQVVEVARQISIVRAVILAAAIALLAPLLAAAFAARGEAGLIAWLGIVPLIAGLRNWRIVQVQQDYSYGAETIANLVSRVAAVLAIFPAFLWIHDARAVLASLIVEAVVLVVLSHVLVPRERVSAVDPAIRREALAFGLPLMANGLGLAVLRQLDQLIVANLFDLATLARYTLAINLAIAPTSVLHRITGKIFLPFLGESRADAARAGRAPLIVVLGTTAAAAALAVPIGLALDRLTPIIYGSQYQINSGFAALAMLAAFLRFSRGGPNMILLDHGQTARLTAGNMVAAVGMLAGFLLGLASRRLEAVLVGLVLGDLVSLMLLIWLIRHLVPLTAVLRQTLVLGVVVACSAASLAQGNPGWMTRGIIMAAAILVIGTDSALLYRKIVATPGAATEFSPERRLGFGRGRPDAI